MNYCDLVSYACTHAVYGCPLLYAYGNCHTDTNIQMLVTFHKVAIAYIICYIIT